MKNKSGYVSLSLICLIIICSCSANHHIDRPIYCGKGLDEVKVGDSIDVIKAAFGEPTERVEDDDILLVYDNLSLDFFVLKQSQQIVEIRFNEKFSGQLENGIRIGNTLEQILEKSGGALKTVEANKEETHGVQLGSDRVLYKQYISGELTGYKFIDSKRGVLFWFNEDKTLIQIVVFEPYSDD